MISEFKITVNEADSIDGLSTVLLSPGISFFVNFNYEYELNEEPLSVEIDNISR